MVDLQKASSPSDTDFLPRTFLRTQALHLVGEIMGLIAKADSDKAIATAPPHVGHSGDERVTGGNFKSAYSLYRGQAIRLKRQFVEQFGLEDTDALDFPFRESDSEFYSDNVAKAKQAIDQLLLLAQYIDPTPPVIRSFNKPA